MRTRLVRLIAFMLVLVATLCIVVMIAGGFSIMFGLREGDAMKFDAVVARTWKLRAWGFTGIGLFLIAVVLLWFTPDSRAQA